MSVLNVCSVGLRNKRIVTLGSIVSHEGLDREGVLNLIAWLCVMSLSLPGALPITGEEIETKIGEALS
jgi:hypothetical protein